MSGRLAIAFKESLTSTLVSRRVRRPPVTAGADVVVDEALCKEMPRALSYRGGRCEQASNLRRHETARSITFYVA